MSVPPSIVDARPQRSTGERATCPCCRNAVGRQWFRRPNVWLAGLNADHGPDPAARQRLVFEMDPGDVARIAAKIQVSSAGARPHQRARADVLVSAVAEAHVDVAHLD